jgi:hypothetical protein
MKSAGRKNKRCAMQVMINDFPVEFELQHDKKVSDVIYSISEWTRERDLVFYEMYIDDGRYSVDMVPDISLSDVKTINCIVQSKADVVFSSVDEAARYCDRVSAFIKHVVESGECNRNDIEDLTTGISWLLEVLSKVCNLLGLNHNGLKYKDHELSHHVRTFETFRESLNAVMDTPHVMTLLQDNREIFMDIKYIFRMLLLSEEMRSLIVQSIDSPDVLISSLRQTREELADQLAGIRAAAIAYQTGKDSEGAERLRGFIDFIYRYTRTCYQAVPMFRIDLAEIDVDGVSLEQKNRELRNLLHEVSMIMENNDIISLSDVLEYEIRPSMNNLGCYIDVLLDKISGK